ncbi:hypothetical protein Tco_0993014 [Tanacetum coccineum]|uniref:Retrovirus-related Pol polyprotein from transposon TNT 1-94 n=1 Tax=Tanacetum coccineum TaxID=301880 RepID=A0ABQ5F538_9ASTR
MAAVNNVPRLVDKKGGSYAAIAPKLESRKFNKWKNRMICYLAGMEPYYLKCIKDGPFQPKTAEGDDKPESQWTPDERKDSQENSDDEVDERSSEEYLRDLDIEFHERALLANSKHYKDEYKKMKAKLVLLEANPSTSHTLKTFQTKNKGLVAETFDWDKEEVSDDEEVTQVKVLMALVDDELTVGKDHARNGEWIDITMR